MTAGYDDDDDDVDDEVFCRLCNQCQLQSNWEPTTKRKNRHFSAVMVQQQLSQSSTTFC